MNGDNQILPLAWAFVPTESGDNWSFFLSHFHCTFPSIDDAKITVISDQSKELEPVLAVEFFNAIHAYCCYHLDENLMQFHSGDEVRNLFWKAVRAQSEIQFQEYLEAIQKLHKTAAEYLDQIPSQHWAKYAIPGPRYGHLTSNIAESVNSSWLDIRNLPILIALESIWNCMMKKFYIRQNRSFKSIILTDYAQQYVESQWELSRRYRVICSNKTTALIYENHKA